MKNENFQMLIEIKTQSGAVLKPQRINFWDFHSKNKPQHLQNLTPSAPFKFYTDALLGLCFHKMTDYSGLTPAQKEYSQKAYMSFDPYTELFKKSAPRVKALRKKDLTQQTHFENFEKKMASIWAEAFEGGAVVLPKLHSAIDCLTEFEQKISSPLIYNFAVHFSPQFTEKLICFYSLLFHLRSVVAVDHNAHVDDSSYESITCDSIANYLPKADYTVNDALLYLQFKKLSMPFVGHKDKDVRLEKLFIEPLQRYFHQYNHNACELIDHLPETFLNSLNPPELEEALHHVQMDWLLGSESGLLFKIREELYGLSEGYDKIFWPETVNLKTKKASVLNLCFELTEKDLTWNSVA